jgi:hypothetical protein
MILVGPTHAGRHGIFVEGDGVTVCRRRRDERLLRCGESGISIKAWLAAFDAFEAMKPRTIVPSHGPVGDGR